MYNITGFPKTKNPVIAAEETKSKSIAIGIIITSLFSEKIWRENMNDTIRIIYAAVPNESINALFIILSIFVYVTHVYINFYEFIEKFEK